MRIQVIPDSVPGSMSRVVKIVNLSTNSCRLGVNCVHPVMLCSTFHPFFHHYARPAVLFTDWLAFKMLLDINTTIKITGNTTATLLSLTVT